MKQVKVLPPYLLSFLMALLIGVFCPSLSYGQAASAVKGAAKIIKAASKTAAKTSAKKAASKTAAKAGAGVAAGTTVAAAASDANATNSNKANPNNKSTAGTTTYPWDNVTPNTTKTSTSKNASGVAGGSSVKKSTTSMSLSQSQLVLYEGETTYITASFSNPSNLPWEIGSNNLLVADWKWDSGLQAIVIVAKSPGEAIITSSLGTVSDRCYVTVLSSSPSVVFDVHSLSLALGETKYVSFDKFYNPFEEDAVFDYSNPDVAEIEWDNEQGVFVISPKQIGKTSLTVYCGSASDVCEIIVGLKSCTITEVTPSEVTMTIGQKVQLIIGRTPYVPKDQLKFSSDNLKVASVNSEGTITAVGVGETNIWVESSSNVKRCFVKVE